MNTTPDSQPINADEIRKYLNFLDDSNQIGTFTFVAMDAESRTVVDKALANYKGDVDSGVKMIEGLWGTHGGANRRATLHVLINRSKAGRKKDDIEAARVLLLDLDTPRTELELGAICREVGPHMVVQSSPGKYHLYWKINDAADLDVWETVQVALAGKFGGDFNLANRAHVIRVPGVLRVCKDGTEFMPHIVWCKPDAVELDLGKLGAQWPWIAEEAGKAREAIRKEREENKKRIAEQRGRIGSNGTPTRKLTADKIGRNETLYYELSDWVYNGINEVSVSATEEEGRAINGMFTQPLGEAEVRKVAKSAWEHGTEAKRRSDERVKAKEEAQAAKGALIEHDYRRDVTPLIEFPFAERGVMERVAQRYGHLILNVDGEVWACNPSTMLWSKQTKENPNIFTHFVEACIDDTMNDPELFQYCRKAEQSEKELQSAVMTIKMKLQRPNFSDSIIRKMLQLIVGGTRFKKTKSDIFDAQDLEIHVLNGLLHLWKGEVRTAQPSDYLTLQAPVRWDEDAECPKFIRRLRDTFPDKLTVEENVRFHVVLIWYCMTALITQQKIFLCTGTGANGKSSYFNVIRMLLGDYCGILQSGSLATQQGSFKKDMERLLVSVENKRTLLADDLETKVIVNEGLFKNVTSKYLAAKPLYKEQRLFTNRAKFLLGCNDLPKPESESDAVIRRMCISEFNQKFRVRPELEKQFAEETLEELSGILAYAVWAARESVPDEGYGALPYTHGQKTALDEYRSEHFILGDKILQLFGPGQEEISSFDIREELRRAWGKEFDVPSAPKLKEVMEKIGIATTTAKKSGYRFYYVERRVGKNKFTP